VPYENLVRMMWALCGRCGKLHRPELPRPGFPPIASTMLNSVHMTSRLNYRPCADILVCVCTATTTIFIPSLKQGRVAGLNSRLTAEEIVDGIFR
jgi:hypothetical protein